MTSSQRSDPLVGQNGIYVPYQVLLAIPLGAMRLLRRWVPFQQGSGSAEFTMHKSPHRTFLLVCAHISATDKSLQML